MQNDRLVEVRDYKASKVEFGEATNHVSKSSDISYGKIPIMYDGEKFLLKVPKCKTMGVQSTEMENGYTRRTMPLVFDDYQSDEQAEFSRVFTDVARNAYEQLVQRGYPDSKLGKLESCFWLCKILYAGIVESMYDSRNNTRYFIGEKEVARKDVEKGIEYDATAAAILIDSIYVGAKTVSIQVKLYEVSLSLASKRGRVL